MDIEKIKMDIYEYECLCNAGVLSSCDNDMSALLSSYAQLVPDLPYLCSVYRNRQRQNIHQAKPFNKGKDDLYKLIIRLQTLIHNQKKR